MEENVKDPLRGVRIRPASQIGLEDESIPYSNQYTRSEEKASSGPVDNDEILTELRRISELLEYLPKIVESLARLEGICMENATSPSSLENVQTVYSSIWGQKQDKARQLLIDLLIDNLEGVDVQRIRTEAATRGISMRTMKETKQRLGLKSEKHGTSWVWKWPDSQ